MTIDPRLKERRKSVAEDRAQRNVVRLLRFLIFVLLIGGAIWLIHSPWLSVSQVEVSGVSQSDTNRLLVDAGVVAGTPMYRIDVNAVEGALESDPWIGEVSVSKRWPDGVEVNVVERVPLAWVNTADGWTRRSLDGTAIPSAEEPDSEMVLIDMPSLADGEGATSPFVLGALEFASALDLGLQAGSVVTFHEGELWATVSSFQVRLGRPVDMRAKAVTLGVLLAEDLAEGSVVILIAPTNPAVMSPEDVIETNADSETASEDGEQSQPDGEGESDG